MGAHESLAWLGKLERPMPGSSLLPIEGQGGSRGWLLVQCNHPPRPGHREAEACADCLHDLWQALGRQAAAEALDIHYHARDGSVFFGNDYIVRGVAGAILWRLAREHGSAGGGEFSLRSLRLARRELRLPELQDNLSVRLALLQQRLAGAKAPLRIEKTGRGRFRFVALRPLSLHLHD